MNGLALRSFLCYVLALLLPSALLGADPTAMVYVSGSTAVNGNPVPVSSAVFPGDLIQTHSSSQANLNVSGASVTVFEDSLVKVESHGLSIQEGSVAVGTSKPDMTVSAGVITVVPAPGGWAEFEVRHLNGAVQVIARKGNVSVSGGNAGPRNETVALSEGQSTTRDDSNTPQNSENDRNKTRKGRDGDVPASATSTPILDSPILIGVGAAAIGGGVIYVLTQNGAPASPSIP